MSKSKPQRIALLAYDSCMGMEIFGVSDVLRIANLVAQAMGRSDADAFSVQMISLHGRSVKAAGGLELLPKRPRGVFDLIIVPGLELSRFTQWSEKLSGLERELLFLRKSFSRGTPVASVCIGAFLLAEAGLLDGRQVTTAWIMAKDLQRRYPDIRVRTDAMLIEDGAIITSGAVSATFDLALHLVKRMLGAEIASATARIALLPNTRTSQAPYIDTQLIPQPVASQSTNFSNYVTQWLAQRMSEPYDLARLAQAFHVSPRTLMRRVKAETGHSPLTLLQIARVNKAKQLLNNTNWSLEKIVSTVGYSDVATFTRLFVREVGETPAQYRRR